MGVSNVRLVDSPRLRDNALGATLVLTVIAYGLVFATFADVLPYPEIGESTVDLLGTVIAILNAIILCLLIYGWYAIRQGKVRRHRNVMLSAFVLILGFLVLYLEKVGGGGIKEFVGPNWVKSFVYFPLLGIHEILSVLAVPFVLYAVLLGVTHTPSELPNTPHPRVGKLAAGAWILSLALGVITYLLLNVIYGWHYTTSLPY